eukprot:TRINITY_DN11941_c5_g1_i1.p1 TRINITY_DN11941_c5_g1~~TRINITY_DN11941_c5_g1_i1.p1  ORF type:complete len:141 (-),score=0.19 TRINITY_DN11941_c5_g1_i1:17-439(-)
MDNRYLPFFFFLQSQNKIPKIKNTHTQQQPTHTHTRLHRDRVYTLKFGVVLNSFMYPASTHVRGSGCMCTSYLTVLGIFSAAACVRGMKHFSGFPFSIFTTLLYCPVTGKVTAARSAIVHFRFFVLFFLGFLCVYFLRFQ